MIGAKVLDRLILIGILALVGACSEAQLPPADPPSNKVTALGLLMKTQVNPTFTRLIVLVFHSEDLEADAETIQTELQQAGAVLQGVVARLRVWDEPPTKSQEGREVFYTYANSVGAASARLAAAIERNDNPAAARELQQIANTCNNCHHFFRLRLKDSVVPSR